MLASVVIVLLGEFGQGGSSDSLSSLESFERELVRVVERVRPVVASVQVYRDAPLPPLSLSGILFDGRGTVVTSGAALEGSKGVFVRFADGPPQRGRVIGVGPERRVGLLAIDGPAPAASFGESDALRPGSIVVAVANPFGLDGSVYFGCVSGLDRTLGSVTGLLQTTVPVNRGDVGGALANARGEIVGMLLGPYRAAPVAEGDAGRADAETETSWRTLRVPGPGDESPSPAPREAIARLAIIEAKAADTAAEGIHFALPIRRVREEARAALERAGRAAWPADDRRRWLGVYLDPAIDPVLRDQLANAGLEAGRGLIVREVYAGSPAERAGLRPHDLLLAIDHEPIESSTDALRSRIDVLRPGASAEFEVLRRGERRKVVVTIE